MISWADITDEIHEKSSQQDTTNIGRKKEVHGAAGNLGGKHGAT